MESTATSDILNQLEDVIWNPLKIANDVLYIKSKFEDKSYMLLITDMVRVWYKSSSLLDIEREKKVFNLN